MIVGLLIVASVAGLGYGIYKHYTLAAFKAEVVKLETSLKAAGSADAKAVIAYLKSLL